MFDDSFAEYNVPLIEQERLAAGAENPRGAQKGSNFGVETIFLEVYDELGRHTRDHRE